MKNIFHIASFGFLNYNIFILLNYFELFYHKNCSNDENISKKAIANYCDSCKPEKIPEFTRIIPNSREFTSRIRTKSPEFGRICDLVAALYIETKLIKFLNFKT
jgi:hypothetical protein